jgi:hypothetical protein
VENLKQSIPKDGKSKDQHKNALAQGRGGSPASSLLQNVKGESINTGISKHIERVSKQCSRPCKQTSLELDTKHDRVDRKNDLQNLRLSNSQLSQASFFGAATVFSHV